MPNALLIFPDQQLRIRVRTLLEESKFGVRDAMTGSQGLQMLQREKSDLILVQENPGVVEIEELVRAIKKISPEQSILVFLETLSMERAVKLLSLGVYDCMEPSFGTVELLGVIRKGLERFEMGVVQPGLSADAWWKNRWVWISLVSGLFLVSGIWAYYEWVQSKERLKQELFSLAREKEFSLPYQHPSGITYDGESFWICDWFSQSVYRHKQGESFEIMSVHHFADVNPVSVSWMGSVLWMVSTNGKIQKHALDEKMTLLNSAKSPGNNPSGIAHDGTYLWTTDSNTKMIYKHLPDDKLTVLTQFPYPGDLPVGLFWDGNNLWSVDGIRKAILRHHVEGNRILIDEVKLFSHYRQQEFKLVGATFDGKRFWSLTESPSMVVRHSLP